MELKAKLPSLDHLHYKDYDYVYEPSDDTFLLCDALANEYKEELSKHFTYCEIGSGSGCVITFIGQLLNSHNYNNPLLLAIDGLARGAIEGPSSVGGAVEEVSSLGGAVKEASPLNI